jgi:hypothetical protein
MKSTDTSAIRIGLIAALGLFSPSAFAYLDPSTGSMILSAIVGIFATVGLALKTYWYKFKSLFSGKQVEAEPMVESLAEQDVERQEGSQP